MNEKKYLTLLKKYLGVNVKNYKLGKQNNI